MAVSPTYDKKIDLLLQSIDPITETTSRREIIIRILIFLFIPLSITVMMFMILFSKRRLGGRSLQWPTVVGKLTKNHVTRGDSHTHHFEYIYIVNDILYSSEKIRFEVGKSGSPSQSIRDLNVNDGIFISYNPNKPEQAVIQPGTKKRDLIFWPFWFIFMGIGQTMLQLGILRMLNFI
ncbi:MAG: hypothetical protein ACW99A_15665 [Candidatus Kariarchaeaceae archaeon]|jgi:hypothetical protein